MNRPSDDVVNEAYERFNRGDFDGWLEFLDPDVELREEYLAPDTGVYRGHEGVRRWLASGGGACSSISGSTNSSTRPQVRHTRWS